MRKVALLLLSVLCIYMSINAQVVTLKRKALSERLTLIDSKVTNKNFEVAIELFYDNDSVILLDNVKKKELEKYNSLKQIIENKKTEFENTDSLILAGIQYYNSLNFDKAVDLLNFKLTEENSYIKTQKKLSEILPKIQTLKTICDSNKVNVTNWQQLFDKEEFEKIFDVIKLKNSYLTSFYYEDLKRIKELQKKLEPVLSQYNSVKEMIIEQSAKCINSLDTLKLTYDNSELYIKDLESILQKNSTDLTKVQGQFPFLTNDISKENDKIKLKLEELKEYRINNKPFTNNEIKQKLFNLTSLNLATVEKYATECDSKIMYIYNNDILKYYDLTNEYDTPLKFEIYKNTQDYKTKYTVLDSIKNGVFYKKTNPMYVDEGWNKTKWEYDIEKKGFNMIFNHSSNGRPPKNIYISGDHDNGFNKFNIYLKSLPTNLVKSSSTWKTNMWTEYLFIPMNETFGLELEEEKDNLMIYFIVNLENVEKIKFQWVNTGRLPFEDVVSTESVVCSSIVRVLIINDVTKVIYFDRTYR